MKPALVHLGAGISVVALGYVFDASKPTAFIVLIVLTLLAIASFWNAYAAIKADQVRVHPNSKAVAGTDTADADLQISGRETERKKKTNRSIPCPPLTTQRACLLLSCPTGPFPRLTQEVKKPSSTSPYSDPGSGKEDPEPRSEHGLFFVPNGATRAAAQSTTI